MVYTNRQKKVSGFTKYNSVELNDRSSGLKNGGNATWPIQAVIDKVAEVFGGSFRVYEFESELIASDIQLGEYALVEENDYRFYKVTNVAPTGNDLSLASGYTAEYITTIIPDAQDVGLSINGSDTDVQTYLQSQTSDFESMAALGAASPDSDRVHIKSFYAGQNKGDHDRVSSGTTGTPGSYVDGIVFDADGNGWAVADTEKAPGMYGSAADGAVDDNANFSNALNSSKTALFIPAEDNVYMGGTPVTYPAPSGSDDEVRITGNKGTISQTGQQTEIFRFASTSDSERFINTGVSFLNFTQDFQSPFVNNNNACFKVLAGKRPFFIGNTGVVDIPMTFGYGYTSDGASATRPCEFGVVALNSFNWKTLGIEFLGASYNSVVGNVMEGDSSAFQHAFRISGYAGAPVIGNAYAGNVAYQGNHGFSIQKSAKRNAVASFTVTDCAGDSVEFTAISGEPGTVAENLPEYNFVACGTIESGPKAVYLLGGERNVVDVIASNQTGNAIETIPEAGGGTANENVIRALVDNSGDRGANITTDGNTLDLSITNSAGISCNISGGYNAGAIKVRNGGSTGLNVAGDFNRIEAHIYTCTGTELVISGNNNVVSGLVVGDIRFDGDDNLFLGRCTGTITENGLINAVINDQVSTTTLLTDITSDVNTKGKFRGIKVYNQNTNAAVFSAGEGAAATWRYSDGTLAHTPV